MEEGTRANFAYMQELLATLVRQMVETGALTG